MKPFFSLPERKVGGGFSRCARRPVAVMMLMAMAMAAWLPAAQADTIVVKDDAGNTLTLAAPARRIVSLAPHITETLYAAGAGGLIVGAVEYSDYPAAAKALLRVGGYSRFDLERIVALKPDLVIGWLSGNPAAQIEQLRGLGLPLFMVQPSRIDDIAGTLERFGLLAGTSRIAQPLAEQLRGRLQGLRSRYSGKPVVRTFYQIWRQPLTTVGGSQVISDVIRLCGGENVFARLVPLAPTVSVEAVIAANPEAIIVSGQGESRQERYSDWKQWNSVTAVQRGNIFYIHPDLMQRHTPRLVDAATQLCEQLEVSRSRRPAAGHETK